MHDTLKILYGWHEKDQIACQIEAISESSDWYRGGRKIGKLRRGFERMDSTSPVADAHFTERILAAHQAFMDRLAVHKLKGPTNQQSLKEAETARIEWQSRLYHTAIDQAEALIADCRRRLPGCGEGDAEGPEGETASRTIDRMVVEIARKRSRIQANRATVAALNSPDGLIGCSANVITVPV